MENIPLSNYIVWVSLETVCIGVYCLLPTKFVISELHFFMGQCVHVGYQ